MKEGTYPMSGADKYAEVCREGAVLGTGRRTRTDARDGLGPLPRRNFVLAHSLIVFPVLP